MSVKSLAILACMMAFSPAGLTVVGFLVMAGCVDEPRPRGDGLASRDSTALRVVESDAPVSPGRWRLTVRPQLVLGGATATGPRMFHRIAGAHRLPDGRIAVADGGSGELRIFGPNGEHRRSWGGEGEGPGEFGELSWMTAIPPDTLVLWDGKGNRLARYRPDQGLLDVRSFAGRGEVVGRFAEGSLLFRRRVSSGSIPARSSVRRDSADYFRVPPRGEPEFLLRLPGERLYFLTSEDGFAVHPAPLTPEPAVAPLRNRLAVADPDAGHIRLFDLAGHEIERWRWSLPRRTLEGGVRARLLERAVARADHPAEREQARRVLTEVELPAAPPLLDSVLTTEMDRAWVRRFTPPGESTALWDVVDGTGRWLTTLEAPADFRIHQAGDDFVLGVGRDAFDAESVRLYGLVRP